MASCLSQHIFEHHYKDFWQYMDSDNVDLYMHAWMDNRHLHDIQVQQVFELDIIIIVHSEAKNEMLKI